MHKLLTAVLALAGLLIFTAAPRAEGHTPEQAKAFVEKAVAFYKSNGKEKALAAFNDPKGEFVEGDLYVVAMDGADGKLTLLAHPLLKPVIGKPQIDQKDADGRAFNQETVAGLAKSDAVWIDYKWPNPATKKIAGKRMYLHKVDDLVIGAGVYN